MTLVSTTRPCYCQAGQVSCGTCERCGEPGHTRHFPGPVPVTGAWCDACYRLVGRRHQLLRWGVPVVLVAVVIAVIRTCGSW